MRRVGALTPEEVRAALADLDSRRQKVVVGLFTVMVREPERVREREWVARQLAEMAVLAGETEAGTTGAAEDAVREVQVFLRANGAELVAAALLLFQRVGLDLAPRARDGLTLEDALRAGLDYLPS
jgi:hypothetical protein